MNFEMALRAMIDDGAKVRRAGWHRAWVCLGKGDAQLAAESFWNKHSRDLAERNGGFATVDAYFLCGYEDGARVQMGWAPSQSDVLASDWETVP